MTAAAEHSRRALAKRVLIITACLGVILTAFSEKGSIAYDLGTMLILATIVIGAFVALYFAKKRAPILTAPPSFAPDAPFVAHLRVRLAAVAGDPQRATAAATPVLNGGRYFLLLGTEGFSVRFRAQAQEDGLYDAQLLRPEEVLQRLGDGTLFRIYDGGGVVAEGTVAGRVAGN